MSDPIKPSPPFLRDTSRRSTLRKGSKAWIFPSHGVGEIRLNSRVRVDSRLDMSHYHEKCLRLESRKELIELIREQAEIERESVEKLAETEQKVGTGAARLLLVEMRCDSQKHAAILEEVLEALKDAQPSRSLWEQAFSGFADPIIVKREIDNHKALSGSMAVHIQKEMNKTDEPHRILRLAIRSVFNVGSQSKITLATGRQLYPNIAVLREE